MNQGRCSVFLMAVLLAACGGLPRAQAQPISPWYPYDGHEYALILERATFPVAEALAETYGGYLATINDTAENSWLTSTFGPVVPDPSNKYIMIGYHDSGHEGNWQWIGPPNSGFTAWNSGEPNGGTAENVAILYVTGSPAAGYWGDVAEPQFGLIERVPEPATGFLLCTLGSLSTLRRRRGAG